MKTINFKGLRTLFFQRQNKVIQASRAKQLLFGGMQVQMHKQCANACCEHNFAIRENCSPLSVQVH